MTKTISRFSPKPPWIRVDLPTGERYAHLKEMLQSLKLHTVCEEARCPNMGECWGGGTATFMVLGDTCTRGCGFCAVKTKKTGAPLDPEEPVKVADSVKKMGLNYVVITSVDRDDLPDQGSGHFAQVVHEVKQRTDSMVEVLIPDFSGRQDLIQKVVDSGTDVMAHNLETVRRLTPFVRDRKADYDQSLSVLKTIKKLNPSLYTKSSLMLGLGETEEELKESFQDLRESGVDILTLGQYLQPSIKHLKVLDYISPAAFEKLKQEAESYGFLYVAAGPLVRSSYRAGEFFMKSLIRSKEKL
ncbi:MAG: lipoyl synthase [Firmicutes bacterium]|nr:lipoyl synthase [Bacillota bacterium]